jgi:hypothetical protein
MAAYPSKHYLQAALHLFLGSPSRALGDSCFWVVQYMLQTVSSMTMSADLHCLPYEVSTMIRYYLVWVQFQLGNLKAPESCEWCWR